MKNQYVYRNGFGTMKEKQEMNREAMFMNIGIIIYSQTGNTRSVVETLADTLRDQSHTVHIESLQPADAKTGNPRIIPKLSAIPSTESYDYLILGAPVHAFSLAPAMKSFLQSVPGPQNKPAGLIVTQQFPFAWMGGNRAMAEFKTLCSQKGVRVESTAIINWSNRQRSQQIDQAIEQISHILSR